MSCPGWRTFRDQGGAVAVKVASEKHDWRFDIPCVGLQTIETCAAAKISVLALEAGKTLLLDREQVGEVISRGILSLTTVG